MDFRLKNKVLQLKYELGSIVGQHPTYYELWCRLFRQDALKRFVSRDTDIVIEGFPRSGNTFAVAAFTISQDRQLKIARHTHKVMQVVRAVEMNVPTLVLIRKPEDAIISLTIRHPYISVQQGLKTYIRYYNGIKPYRMGYILAKFEDVTTNYGHVIEQVNQQFGTDFQIYRHTSEQKAKAFQLVERMHREYTNNNTIDESAVARPSKIRLETKRELLRNLDKNQLKVIREEAFSVYQELLST